MADKFEKFLAFSIDVYKRNPMIFSKGFVFPCISTELIAADEIIALFETPNDVKATDRLSSYYGSHRVFKRKFQFSSNLQRI